MTHHQSSALRRGPAPFVALVLMVAIAVVAGSVIAGPSAKVEQSTAADPASDMDAAVNSDSNTRGPSLSSTSPRPIVVEMFTSQGCSSCPPADRNLARLGDGDLAGEGIIPLAFHVDYWNYIGWVDPFSDERWRERQERYAAAFRTRRIYTPQAVIQGRHDCVGSRTDCLRQAIDEERRRPAAAVIVGEISIDETSDKAAPTLRLDLGARVESAIPASDGSSGSAGNLQVWAALYERDLNTRVDAGENARRTLHNDYVVRWLEPAFKLASRPGTQGDGTVEIPLPKGWRKRRLGVAAVVQDPTTQHIHAAWSQNLDKRR